MPNELATLLTLISGLSWTLVYLIWYMFDAATIHAASASGSTSRATRLPRCTLRSS